MRDLKIVQELKDLQCDVFRVATDPDRKGKTLKQIAYFSGLKYDRLCTYATGKAVLPMDALVMLIGVIPDELLSQLLPGNRIIVQVPENVDFDEVATWAERFSARKLAAHRKDSECEEQIGPNEEAELSGIVVAFPAKAA